MIFEAIILGILQGFTEFLPISSTAHLILFPWLFGWSGEVNTLTFDIALHSGTLIALIVCFYKDWFNLIIVNRRLLFLILIASIPAGFAGFILNDFVELYLREPLIICVTLISIGVLMLYSERKNRHKPVEVMGFFDACFIGIAQAFAIIPGVSRSGITISAGLLRGFERDASAKFSFLLSTPIIAGATMLHAIKFFKNSSSYNTTVFITGLSVSFITGVIAIKFLLSFLKRHPLNIFVYYRFLLSAVIITMLWMKD